MEDFKYFRQHMLVPDGKAYTSLNGVTKVPAPYRDNMESFWLVRYFNRVFCFHDEC